MGSDIGLRQLFMMDFDKKLEQHKRAAGYANPDEKVDLFLKRRANLFNLGRSARVLHRRPLGARTVRAGSLNGAVPLLFLQAGSSLRSLRCSNLDRRSHHGWQQRSCKTASMAGAAHTKQSPTSTSSM